MINEVYSRCGQRCDLCLIHRANVEKEDRRAELCAVWGKLGPEKYDPETTICDGCMADGEDAVLFSGGGCKCRKCVMEKGLQHCGHCSDYPCDYFPAEPDADEFYKDLERRGVDWTPEDDKMMAPYNPKSFMDAWRKDRNTNT